MSSHHGLSLRGRASICSNQRVQLLRRCDKRLPDDLIIEIIIRLPVKYLLSFKCVSKYWCGVIKSPHFIKQHLHKQQRAYPRVLLTWIFMSPFDRRGDGYGLFNFRDLESPKLDHEVCPNLSVPFPSRFFRPLRLLGPCNGLVCIVSEEHIVMCNPALREYKQLPKRPFKHRSLTFIIGVGFGNTCLGDVKLVVLYGSEKISERQFDIQAHVYNLAANSWTKIDFDPKVGPDTDLQNPCSQIFFKGACHWHSISFYGGRHNVILSMDINAENFKLLEYPDCIKEVRDNRPYLIVQNECLGFIRQLDVGMEVWAMKEYGLKKSWSKLFVTGHYPPIHLLVSWKSLKNDDFILANTPVSQLVSCALDRTEFKKFPLFGVDQAVTYTESLIRLGQIIY